MKIHVFGHQSPDTDSICSAIAYAELKKKLGYENIGAYRLGNLNKETEFVLEHFGIDMPELLELEIGNKKEERKKVILVDHNEKSQSVEGLENCEILEIIDHHRIADIQTDSPILVRIEPLGCTATIVYKMYKEEKINITREIAGIMLSAILSDTLIFTSPTCTEIDKIAGKELAEIAGKDIESYGKEMFTAGASLEGFTATEILEIDRKKFSLGDYTAYISQVNTMDLEDTLKLKDEFFDSMDEFLEKVNGDISLLMITDIEKNASEILIRGKKADVVRNAFGIKESRGSIFLEGVVSRKKQIIPKLTLLLQSEIE